MIDRMNHECLEAAVKGDLDTVNSTLNMLGMNVNPDISGNTLMHIAAYNGDYKLAYFLIEFGFSTSIRNNDGYMPEDICRIKHNYEMQQFFFCERIVEFLMNTIVEGKENDFTANIHIAMHYFFNRVISKKPYIKAYPLHYIVFYNRKNILRYISDHCNIEFNCQESNMCETPLHIAAQFDFTEIIDILTANNVNINQQDSMGWTPLHRAVINNNIQATKILLNCGAQKNTVDIMNNTPLKTAEHNGNTKLIKMLQ